MVYDSEKNSDQNAEQDLLLALAGSGSELWADENPDEYVRRLREDWQSRNLTKSNR
ncbi:MAG TPA: hypothetical protein VNK23_03945 [Candidatus Dormibacteraeota bacterium]|nr:hypothetical protein [Candidatus Dormibacteraeota bacterium]